MKKLVVGFLMLAVGAAGVARAGDDVRNNWKSTETVGKYGYVESGGSYYPLDNGDDFDYCFRKDSKKGGDLVRKGYVIYLTANYTANNLVADGEVMRIYLNGHKLKVNGDVKVSALTTWCLDPSSAFEINGGGGTISFPYSTSEAAFTVGYDSSYFSYNNRNFGSVRNVTFANCKGRAFVLDADSFVDMTFSNVTFDQCSADCGSCIYLDCYGIWLKVNDCTFSNCSASDDGGAVYINNVDPQDLVLTFSNCIVKNCHADDGGGFMYINDGDAVVNGCGNTVIFGCTAAYGGGVYANWLKTLDGFVFADNTSAKNGGAVNNCGSDSTISNCRFYRNAAGSSSSKYRGGGLYFDDRNGNISNCRFFENAAYQDSAELYVDDNSTKVNGCTFTSNFSGDAAVKGGTRDGNCKFLAASAYGLTKGGGTEANPFRIENVDDWDALYFSVKNGNTYGNKPFIVLSSNIVVVTTIGGFNSDPDLKRPFKGTFDGNGHTITLYSLNGGSDKATFGCAQGATVRNLTVNGRIEGAYSLGGIFGNGSGSTASNCVNNATIVGTAHYIGGIAGWSGNGSKFINCVNNGKVEGDICVGGIAGLSGNGSRFLNCLNFGEVAGTKDVGGIVGSEESAVSVENCYEFGSFNFPANGDFVIYTALDGTMCLDFEGSGMFITDDPRIWTADGSEKQTFTLKYDQSKGGYIIKSKHSGLVLMRDTGDGSLYQYDDYNYDFERWEFIPTGDGYYYIHSLDCSSTEGYLDVTGAKADEGTNVGTYTFNGNANQKFRLVRVGDSGGITGHSASGSTHEMCVFSKDDSPDNGCGIGVSHDALWGSATDTVDGKEFKMPDYVNDYIAANGKQKDGWLRVGFTRSGQPVIVPNGPTDELGYSVGQISGTEYIFWKLGKLYRVTDGVAVELPYTLVGGGTSSFDDGKWYVVEGVVERGKITVNGTASLVLVQGASLTASGGNKEAGIAVTGDNVLSVFGVRGGLLTANGGGSGAGIGGGYKQSCGTVTINGGTVTATGGSGAAGIGGGDCGGAGGSVTINGGVVTANGSVGGAGIGGGSFGMVDSGDLVCGNGGNVRINGGVVTATGGGNGAQNIGGGTMGKGGTLALGSRVIKFDDSHWGEFVTSTFDVPVGLRLVSASVNVGGIKVTENGADRRIVQLSKESSLKLAFGALNDFVFPQEFAAEVTFGPISENIVIGAGELPKAPMNDQLVVQYALPDGTIASTNAYPLHSTDLSMTMGYDAWYVVMGEVTTAVIDVKGEVNLILADDAKLTVNGGIRVPQGNAFAIYGQRTGSGTLTASGSPSCAGIGGDTDGSGGTVTINGGTVTATGGGISKKGNVESFAGGAGIGGGGRYAFAGAGRAGNGGRVTINGGTVTAIGGGRAAGIGGGGSTGDLWPGAGGEVKITGGTVTAQGDGVAAGIGGGANGWGNKANAGTVDLDRTVDVVEGEIGNNSSYVKIAKQTPSCIGGEIAKGAGGVWVVTPEDGATEVAIKYFPKDDFVAVPPTVTKVEGVDDEQIRVRDGNTDVTSQYFIHGGVISPFETFDDGRHYIESSGGAYIDTGYVPTINTRIMADFNSMTGGETAFAISEQESICIFCGYDEDGQCQPQAMQLYSFQIYEGDAQKRDFVPFRTTDGTEIVGLYDRVTQKCFVNAGGGSLTLNGPMCEGGKIAKDKNGVWVVTPDAGVTEVTIGNLLKGDTIAVPPTVTKVEGVADGQIRVYSGGKDITRNFAIKDGVIKRLFCTVTVGNLSYMTAVWTSDEGETNAVVSGSFDVPVGETGVTVIFTPEKCYVLIGEGVVGLGTVTDDITFGSASGYLVPAAGIPYLDWDAKNNRMVKSARAVANCNFVASGTTSLANGGWYAVKGSVKISSKSLSVSGSAHLILTDGSSLTITGTTKEESALKVPEGSSLTIYGQDAGSGRLSAVGGRYSAGIGGSKNFAGGTVTINGGTVTATGGLGGAGIGGGDAGAGGTVMINGGTVTATGVGGEGNGGGAGIGGGSWGVGGAVTIRGGMVTAIGQDGGKGIGGGKSRNGGSVAIYGGTVRAEGSDAFGETVTLGEGVFAYDITDGEPGTRIGDAAALTSVDKILVKTLTCTGGDIEKVDGVWVVVPNSGVEAVTIKNLPDGATVAVKLNGYTVPAAAFMGFGTGENANVFSLALDPEGEVNGVRVQPTIGELSEDEGEPFVVGEGSVAVTIRSIPGLKYELKRTTNLAADFGSIGDGVKAVGTGAPVTLEDPNPPSGAAFYTIGVSVP